MADKCIGKLTLDISDVEKKVAQINEALSKAGSKVNINLSKTISKEVKAQLDAVIKEIDGYKDKISSAVDKAVSNVGRTASAKSEGAVTKQAIALWKEYYQVLTQAQNARNAGQNIRATYLENEAASIKARANALKEEVEIEKELEKVRRNYNASVKGGTDKSLARALAESKKDEKDALEKAAKAWTEYYDKMAQAERAFQNGDNTNGTKLRQEAESIRERAAAMRDEADVADRVAAARKRYEDAYAATGSKERFAEEKTQIKEAVGLWNEYYNTLTRAEKAIQGGDTIYGAKLRQEAESIRERAAALRDEADVQEQVTAARNRYNEAYEQSTAKARTDAQDAAEKQHANDLKELINLYVQYYDLKTRQVNATNNANVDMYREEAESVREQIAAVEAENPALAELASSHERVTEAIRRQIAAENDSHAKSAQAFDQAQVDRVKAYADALVDLYNKQTEINNGLTKGTLKEGTAEYEDAQAALQRCADRALEAGDKLKKMGVDANEAVSGIGRVQDAAEKLVASEDRLAGADINNRLGKMKQAYFELTDAIKNYNTAKKTGDDAGMAASQHRINEIMQEVSATRDIVEASNIEAGVKTQILNLIQQCTTAESQHNAEINGTVKSSNELSSQLQGLITRYLSIVAVIRTINSLIKNTVEYVSEYSNKMNEIRIITGNSEEEIDKMAETYRSMAADMSVSSLDMADAAIYFTRQGLDAEKVEKRLKNTTMYAKTANIEFERAAELITSVVNSMNLEEQEMEDGRNAAQRVADVFLKIGDSAATSGREIGEAMQKAGAAAGAFGMEFEWLASYIATVSETTRQEATSIGTAFNTLIARLHSIRKTGFFQDDETKINDIQRALSLVNVQLLDQEGNWRDITTIFQEVADQWDTLDGKTKSYIATTMAGVKQQNVFLALMEDLSKKNRDDSRAWELHEKAINSAGTAQQKYGVYTESVAAAQERLTVAQEKFYSLLDDSVIKSWYEFFAGWVNMIADGASAWGSWTVILPVVAGAVAAVVVAMKGLNASLTTTLTLTSLIEKHPIIMAISAAIVVVGGLVSLINLLASAGETSEEKISRLSKTIEESNSRISKYNGMQSSLNTMFAQLGADGADTNKVLDDHKDLLNEIAKISPAAREAVDGLRNGMMDQKDVAAALNEELERYITTEHLIQAEASIDKTKERDKSSEEFARLMLANGIGKDLENPNDISTVMAAAPDSVAKFIKERQEEFKDALGDDEAWMMAGREAVMKFLDGMDPGDYLNQTANQIIDGYMQTIGDALSAGDAKIVRQQFAKALFGEDGILDPEDWDEMDANAEIFMRNLILNRFNPDKLFDGESQIRSLGEELFGKFFDLMFGDQLSGIVDKEAYANILSEEFAELLGAGFDSMDVASLLRNTPLSDWGDMVMMMTEQIKESLKEKFGTDSLGFEEIFEDLDTGVTFTKMSGYWDDLDIATLKLINDLADLGVTYDQINQLMETSETYDDFIAGLQNLGKEMNVTDESTEEATISLEEYGKEIKSIRGDIDDLNSAIETLEGGGQLKFSDLIDLASAHPEILSAMQSVDELKAKLQEVSEGKKAELRQKIRDMYLDSEEFFKGTMYAEVLPDDVEIKTMREYIAYLDETGESTEYVEEHIDSLVDGFEEHTKAVEEDTKALKTWLQTQAEVAKANSGLNWAKSNEYSGQIGELSFQSEESGDGMGERMKNTIDTWNAYDEKLRTSIAETYPELVGALAEVEAALADYNDETKDSVESERRLSDAERRLSDTLKKTRNYLNTKYFKDSAKAIKNLEEGTISAADAYDIFYKECDKVTKAQDEIVKAQKKLDEGTDLVESDVNSLADVLGVSADQIKSDFPGAVDTFNQLIAAGGELQSMFDSLNKAAFIRITGSSEADFSNLMEGLLTVQDAADETVQQLLATGQFELETKDLEQQMDVWEWRGMFNGGFVKKTATGKATFLKPKGNNKFFKGGGGGGWLSDAVKGSDSSSSKSGGGGGGGGGGDKSSDKNQMTEVEKMLSMMEKINDIQNASRGFYQAQSGYYSQTGELQGVIAYSQKEIEVLEKENQTLQDNIARIEQYLEMKRAELAALSTSDEKYEEVADDVDKLQKAHQQYTEQLIGNKTAIDQLNKTIEEQHKKIRDMEIDLRNTVVQALEDSDEKRRKMLDNEVNMENKIFEIIKKRYEDERDEILRLNDLKIKALEDERDLLGEQLNLRKQLSAEEDKTEKLAELEAQYQRISADPTRRKEGLEFQKKMADLREEMAWDAAENEVKAQQDSLDQQITSLEDYADYINEYYDDLFKHPQKLIEEMREIIKQSDEEIIKFLKENDEEYMNSSRNRQKQLEEEWVTTIDDMHGRTKTFWDEAEIIIAQGEDAVIDFLKNNSKAYAEAGELQAEAYVEEWLKKFDDLRKAYENIQADIAPEYQPVADAEGSGSSGSSGGGGGGGGGSGSKKSTGGGKDTKTTSAGTGRKGSPVEVAFGLADTYMRRGFERVGGADADVYDDKDKKQLKGKLAVYGSGGMARTTGPAWLDGTPDHPEAVLSPYHTELFETMVNALEKVSRVSVAPMPGIGNVMAEGSRPVSVGDIIVQVDNLNTDDDYETLAKKVSDVLMERIGRTLPVGGLRVTAY